MDYEALRAGLSQAVPFNVHLGLEVAEVGPGLGVVVLPEGDHLVNHVGSQHAGALFGAGEAASGAAFISAFAERLAEIRPLAKAASIDYTKIARGPITATGRLDGAEELLARLDTDGTVEFPVHVEMTDGEGNVVANMTVDWHVRKTA